MTNQLPFGFTFAGVAAGIKKTGAADLALIASNRPCAAAAVFTRNAFPAAPVLYDRALVAEHPAGLRAVAINAGCANACTGEAGLQDAAAMAAAVEAALDLPSRSAAVMSTGVIGPRLPLAKIVSGLADAANQMSPGGWDAASRAIMTTDTRPKVAFRQVGAGLAPARLAPAPASPVRLFGMCKGAGMIHPNMATMLAVIVTDAAIAPAPLAEMLRAAVDVSFNAISVDGDTSTNDTVLLLANGASETEETRFLEALTSLCTDLAQQIVRDGEGATKFITIQVAGAASDDDARKAAKAVANSPLVKTAFYGGDANWGRILAAVGYSGALVDPAKADLWIAADRRGEASPLQPAATAAISCDASLSVTADSPRNASPLQLVRAGQPLPYLEEAATAIFAGPEIVVTVTLGLGAGQATVWTCDLSHDYVDINGHYRT